MPEVWWLTGTTNMAPLVRLSRNMVVLRDGDALTLINAVRLDDAGLAALDALGTVRHVMKIGMHGMDDDFYVERSGAQRWTVADLRAAASLPVPDLSAFFFEHTVQPEAALLLSRDGGLLLTCDAVQHWETSALMSPMAKVATRLMGFMKPAQIGPPWRKKMTPDGGSLRPDFERLVALPFDRLLGGHGGMLETGAQAALRTSIDRELGAA